MGSKRKTIIYGIAYHSPLDIFSLVPDNVKVTFNTATTGSNVVLFNKKPVKAYDGIQIVFASQRDLEKDRIPILDQGRSGKILNLKQIQWNSFLKSEGKEK